ncbi:MAG: DNA-processing protein DprA [Bacteroidota bacterium]
MIRDLLRLSTIPRVGPQKIRALVGHFKTPAAVFAASPIEIARVPGIDKNLASTIAHFTGGDEYADDQLRRLNRLGARIVTVWESEYPDLLRKIYDPPAFLFLLGNVKAEDNHAIAIVGTRLPSAYGEATAEMFSRELSRIGITTVSGLARGVDTIVHSATLKAGGRTIAVIGSGLDVPYPPENRKLMERIGEEGAVVSEFPMGTTPDPQNFPRRNRIISGLSLGTLVVESAEDGGAMITASTALDQNREVFAVPGMISEKRTVGPHKLIKEGRAKLVQCVEDIVEELRPLQSLSKKGLPTLPPPELSLFEQRVYDILDIQPIHVDSIAEKADMSTSDVLVNLLSLEFKGIVKQLPGKMFVKNEF